MNEFDRHFEASGPPRKQDAVLPLREAIAAALLHEDQKADWSEAIEVGVDHEWLKAADAAIEVMRDYPMSGAVDALSDAEILERVRSFYPHDDHGTPVLTMHGAMWARIVKLLERGAEQASDCTKIADFVESLAAHYPANIFTPEGKTPDGIAGTALREMLPRIAERIRLGEWRDDD